MVSQSFSLQTTAQLHNRTTAQPHKRTTTASDNLLVLEKLLKTTRLDDGGAGENERLQHGKVKGHGQHALARLAEIRLTLL